MKIKIWSISIALYVGVLIAYHRFENSKYALEILGNIPTLLASIATAGAFAIAAATYVASSKRAPSKDAFEVYKETLDELKRILRGGEDKGYKLYQVGVSFDALADLNQVVTEADHRSTLLVKLVPIKHEIELLLKSYRINDYFCHDVEHDENYYLNVSSCADAFYTYWLKNIVGKSAFYERTEGKVDFFSSYPFSIDDTLLIKALSLCSQDLDLHTVQARIAGTLRVVSSNEKHELIELSERLPEAVAFLLLKNQTEPYGNNGEIKLKLRQTFNERYWIQYRMSKGSWQVFELPSKLAL
ncbi:hypothetical protein KIP00_00130 [Vibrio sp. B513a]|uniref:hypothetical protein n=1 Tax=Vibrio sp. B513a TaxID=2836183 RepID=UPI0025573638|nr:hypothetical protein [Vibrio sp. B513a]MDK9749422.1 hypothetical protein [Vibrio sp. B513a]